MLADRMPSAGSVISLANLIHKRGRTNMGH